MKKKYEDIEHRNYKLSRLVEQANMKLSKNNFRLPSIIDNVSLTLYRDLQSVGTSALLKTKPW